MIGNFFSHACVSSMREYVSYRGFTSPFKLLNLRPVSPEVKEVKEPRRSNRLAIIKEPDAQFKEDSLLFTNRKNKKDVNILKQEYSQLCKLLSCIQLCYVLNLIETVGTNWYEELKNLLNNDSHQGDLEVIKHVNTIFKERPLYRFYLKDFETHPRVDEEEGVTIYNKFYPYNSRVYVKEKVQGVDSNHKKKRHTRHSIESEIYENLSWLLHAFNRVGVKVEGMATRDSEEDKSKVDLLQTLFQPKIHYHIRQFWLDPQFSLYEKSGDCKVTLQENDILVNGNPEKLFNGKDKLIKIRDTITTEINANVRGGIMSCYLWNRDDKDNAIWEETSFNEMSKHAVAFTFKDENEIIVYDTLVGMSNPFQEWVKTQGVPTEVELLLEREYVPNPKKSDTNRMLEFQ